MNPILLFVSVLIELFVPGSSFGKNAVITNFNQQLDPLNVKISISELPVKTGSPREVFAESGKVADLETGQRLLSKNSDKHMPIASITKLMTAVVIIKNHDLDEVVTVPSFELKPLETSMGLKKGDKISVGELLHGLLIPSGADAAIALATFHSGTLSKFVEAMNDEADKIRLAKTHFKNPIGEDEEGAYSTADDLIALARVAMTSKTLKDIVATKSYVAKSVDGKRIYRLKTTNQILDNKFIFGIKTGFTNGAGQCLLAYARREGHPVISIVLNSPDRFNESYGLLTWAFANYDW